MGFATVQYYNYRNLKDQRLRVDAPEVFLVGANGQGKTNFIESVYLLCSGRSFRVREDRRMIRHGQEEASVQGSYRAEGAGERTVAVRMERGGRREIRRDGKALSDRAELMEQMPCIIFSHQDMQIVMGSPEHRRRFFHQTLGLYDPLFLSALRGYRKALRSRNLVLKEGSVGLLDALDSTLAALGCQVQAKVDGIVEEFNRTFSELFRQVSGSGEEARLEYRPSWRGEQDPQAVRRLLSSRRERDLSFQTTTTGPHRDRFLLLQRGREFAQHASTGQVRLAALVLRVAQARFFSFKSGRLPLLLLDDVLLELDSLRRERFLQMLPASEQSFFTFLPDEQYSRYRREATLVYRVEAGEFLQGGQA